MGLAGDVRRKSGDLAALRSDNRGFSVSRAGGVAAGVQHLLPHGCRRDIPVLRPAGDAADAAVRVGVVGSHQVARQGVHDRLPGAGDADDRRVLRARHGLVLHLLRRRADPDVPHHRCVGRTAARLFGVQVLSLYAHWLSAVLRCHPDAVPAGRHNRHSDAHRLLGRPRIAAVAVACVPSVVRGEAADVAGAHLAAGRACRSADGGLGGPCRGPAEDGRLRFPALLATDAAAGLERIHAADLCAERHRHRLHLVGRAGAGRT